MTTPFADLEAELNVVAFAELANATADFGSGKLVGGVFDAAYMDPLGIIAGARPVFSAPESQLATVTQSTSVSIRGKTYTVADIQPDGRGVIVLLLK